MNRAKRLLKMCKDPRRLSAPVFVVRSTTLARRRQFLRGILNLNVLRLGVVLAAYLLAGTSFSADRNKVLHVASTNIETLDPQRWNDDPSYQIQFAIFEGLYEWDYLASPSRLVPNTATLVPTSLLDNLIRTQKQRLRDR